MATAAEAEVLDVTRYAKCSGVSDDTDDIRSAIGVLASGDTLLVPAGRECRHSDVLTIRTPGVRIAGSGSLTATNEQRSSVVIAADHVTFEGVTLRMAATTRRWDAYDQMKLRVAGHTGVVIRGVAIDGAAAAGIFVGNGASNYLIEDVRVENTRADGIHNTDGANNGIIRRPVIRNTGDDGVAVVSYVADQRRSHHIRVESPRFFGNTWGRAYTVVGGDDIVYKDIYAERSNAAGVYVAAEGHPYYTYAPRRIRVSGGLLRDSNTNPEVDHGAVLIYNGRPGFLIEKVSVTGLAVEGTRVDASRQIGVFADESSLFRKVALTDIRVTGGGQSVFASNVEGATFSPTGMRTLKSDRDHSRRRARKSPPRSWVRRQSLGQRRLARGDGQRQRKAAPSRVPPARR